jgi:hypothetical protein
MAKRKTGGWCRRWLRNVRANCLASTLMAGLCSGTMLRAADFVLASNASSNAVTAALEYQETDYPIVNWGVSLTTQTAPFPNEPAAASGKIVRGVLSFGGESSNDIAFVWQRDAGKLFLDLNRNRNFTNHPANIFSARSVRPVYYQTFTNIHLPFNTAAGKCQVLADLNFWDYSSRPSCSLAVRSFWQGKVTLQGRDWQAGLVQNVVNPTGALENGQFLLRPWAQRSKPFSAFGTAPDAVPFTRKLFLDGHAYQLDPIIAAPDGAVRLALQFTEKPVALGEIKISGKYVQRLVLSGGPYLVLLDDPAGTVKIPTGSYNQPNIRLGQNGTEALCNSSQSLFGRQLSVNDKTPTVLNLGGPLTNSVTVSRHGEDLRLDYRLVGVGGETYQLANEDRSHPPEFAIYKDAKKIASGKFEFG